MPAGRMLPPPDVENHNIIKFNLNLSYQEIWDQFSEQNLSTSYNVWAKQGKTFLILIFALFKFSTFFGSQTTRNWIKPV